MKSKSIGENLIRLRKEKGVTNKAAALLEMMVMNTVEFVKKQTEQKEGSVFSDLHFFTSNIDKVYLEKYLQGYLIILQKDELALKVSDTKEYRKAKAALEEALMELAEGGKI